MHETANVVREFAPRAQFDPELVYATLTAVTAGEIDTFRNPGSNDHIIHSEPTLRIGDHRPSKHGDLFGAQAGYPCALSCATRW